MKNKVTIFFLLVSGLFTVLFSFSIIFALNANVLGVSPELESKVVRAMPQGWGFFSKDARDPMIVAYPLNDNKEEELQWPNNTIKNMIGLNRYGRAQGIELGSIISEIPNSKFVECEQDYKNCIVKQEDITEIDNVNKNPTICDQWGIALLDPVPWAWADSVNESDMASIITKVDVKCSKT
ncbi:SdpA family antimicrobial peptide system protein [Oceanobacillus kimchii]|uniref:SdpA family antimicrobial peptide system protein n=1 Tax=Oceanobacillus kimchii TaxID=746691 RepID=A0ABQ5TGW8_9BACI|nr:SdpA family antimicrobial peptide system protein [Oceanobacillus kimchii]GLO66114.1 hypothetical protein MACH08_18980 [Oceanobacillus kimchii]